MERGGYKGRGRSSGGRYNYGNSGRGSYGGNGGRYGGRDGFDGSGGSYAGGNGGRYGGRGGLDGSGGSYAGGNGGRYGGRGGFDGSGGSYGGRSGGRHGGRGGGNGGSEWFSQSGGGGGGGGGGRDFPPLQRPLGQQQWHAISSGEAGPSRPKHSPPVQAQTPIQVDSDSGSLKKSEQTAAGYIAPVPRPDKGGKSGVRKYNLSVNHFVVSFNPKSIIWHYDVDVKVKSPPKNNRPQKISKSEFSLIRKKLFEDPSLPSLMTTAYDGEKNIFSAVRLPEGTFGVDVTKGENDRTVSYSVTLKLVKPLELRKLSDYFSGTVPSIPRDILQGLDLVVKENPTNRCTPAGRCFFPMDPPLKQMGLGEGIVAIGGFQQSLKPTSQGLSLCLDYSVLSFQKKVPVLDFLKDHIRGFNLKAFDRFKNQVEQALFGLKVNVTHRRTKQKYTIVRLTTKATRDITFPILDSEGRKTSEAGLLDYFWNTYRVDIQYKDIPALDFGGSKTNYVPMELCVLVQGERFPKEKLGRDAARDLKKMSVAPPRERLDTIQTMVTAEEGPFGGNIIQNFDMGANTSMTNVTGRVIKPPQLKLRNRNGEIVRMTLEVEKCQWNLVGRSMVEGKPVTHWGILDFTIKERDHWCKLKEDKFVDKLIEKYKDFGIVMEKPVVRKQCSMSTLGDYQQLYNILRNIDDDQKKYQRRLQFLLCVMANKHQGYKCLKWIAETKVGIVTQCCLSVNANEGKDQYLTNLALKINAKIGGSNVELLSRLPHFKGEGHVMFIGADVNHPASRDYNSPSIAAVVATVNWPAANQYAARVCAQNHRVEKIENFGGICLELVSHYERLNKVRPEKIVIFRDGVSESQFQMVLNEELQNLKKVFGDANYLPTITLIVAQKRHQTRFFPTNPRDGISNGNVLPGTVVDTEVVHPFEFDFYLCSHYGSLGTSKPTHYHVLWDDEKFTSDELQKLIYDMCFTFARCTKPVSLVPPVYYADLTAYRGRLYYEAMNQMQYSGSAASSSSSSRITSTSVSSAGSSLTDLGPYKLHADVENIMFFI